MKRTTARVGRLELRRSRSDSRGCLGFAAGALCFGFLVFICPPDEQEIWLSGFSKSAAASPR